MQGKPSGSRRSGYEVIEEHSFWESAERLGLEARLVDEIFEDKVFVLGRNPRIHAQVPNRNLYRIKINKTARWPALRAWFEIHGNNVLLVDIDLDWENQ